MPELPEVETIRAYLEKTILGERIERVRLARPDLRFPFPPNFAQTLQGRRIRSLQRRGKTLLVLCAAEPRDQRQDLLGWLVHFGMSGRMLLAQKGSAPCNPHTHVRVELRSKTLCYEDSRRFGFMTLYDPARPQACRHLKDLGDEPLSHTFAAARLQSLLANRSCAVKAALMDQRLVAGIGNIYALEALWQAGLHPMRIADTLSLEECRRLVRALKATLRRAIDAGGASFRDYRQADGSLGYFQHQFRVYGRAGQACPRRNCKGVIERLRQLGRASDFCPLHQRL